jgi:hypothetical protein
MAEEKETDFKITDRRKFYSDGSPREQSEQPAAAQVERAEVTSAEVEAENQPPTERAQNTEDARNNVVSFPGEPSKKKEQARAEAPADQSPVIDQQASKQADESALDQQAKAAASAAEQAYNQTRGRGSSRLPEASFLALADMLAGEAAMCLGLVKDPAGAEMPIDLDTGRHLIDMLGMLKEKTRGNLNSEENDVLENILAYLRMQFVALSRNQ